MSTFQPDTVVIGGGIIGMTTALSLSDQGQSVTVVDPGRRQGISSWAGGGILSPLYPWRHDDAVNGLARRSQQLYPDLCRRIRDRTGVDPELRSFGMLYADLPSQPPLDRERARDWAQTQGVELQELEGDALTGFEPALSPVAEHGLRLPEISWVRNPRLMRGLNRLAREAGVELMDGATVLRLRAGNNGVVEGVETDAGTVEAERVVVAAGPWSGQLLAQVGVALPVRPVKGSMLLLQGTRSLLGEVVMTGSHYLIPRADGRLLVGSTTEEAGFDSRTGLGSVRALSQAAVEMVPETANLELETFWSGLRPGSPDDRPFIGAVPGCRGLYVSTGHYRNGVVHAPASAELLAAQIAGAEPAVDPSPFAPDRELPHDAS
ncbi:glycine oxidase ThiO [Thiohalorhabdus methylotrophus]|uniref:Glycine oxidase ThiO n=1 Tax=Thiohalorhabdus methylotrophus TaxID=3242694 RepID=A0ABV4TVB3_9GAMM